MRSWEILGLLWAVEVLKRSYSPQRVNSQHAVIVNTKEGKLTVHLINKRVQLGKFFENWRAARSTSTTHHRSSADNTKNAWEMVSYDLINSGCTESLTLFRNLGDIITSQLSPEETDESSR